MLTRNICVAFVAALLFHFIVLVQKFVVHNEPKLDKEVISVVISYDERVKPQPQTKSEPQNIEAKQDIVPPPPLATVITTTDQIPVRSIEYVTEVNGKRTCYVRVANLLDAGGSDNWVGTACTPQKKFDVKLNQPNNGWADR